MRLLLLTALLIGSAAFSHAQTVTIAAASATWIEGATTEVSRTATDGIETVTVRAQTSTTATPRGFLRVRKTFP